LARTANWRSRVTAAPAIAAATAAQANNYQTGLWLSLKAEETHPSSKLVIPSMTTTAKSCASIVLSYNGEPIFIHFI